MMDRAEAALNRAQDASAAAALAVQHGTLVVQVLAVFLAAAVIFVTVYSILRSNSVAEEARNAVADARRYLDDLRRLCDQAENARTDAENSARKSRDASEEVRASVSAAQRTLEQLEAAVSSGRTGAFLNWIELSRCRKMVGDRAGAVASLDHALADAEQSESTNPNEYTMLAGSYDDALASGKALACIDKALKLTEAEPRPHELFVKGTILLNYQRSSIEQEKRARDCEQAEEFLQQALELHGRVGEDRKLDQLTVGKLKYFIGL
jgi:tetratricopeptide (TPR) repeat protein